MQSASQRMETPSDLPLPLMDLFKEIVPMPFDHNILIPVEDATFELPIENIYVSEDIFQFSRMGQISATCIAVYMKQVAFIYIALSFRMTMIICM